MHWLLLADLLSQMHPATCTSYHDVLHKHSELYMTPHENTYQKTDISVHCTGRIFQIVSEHYSNGTSTNTIRVFDLHVQLSTMPQLKIMGQCYNILITLHQNGVAVILGCIIYIGTMMCHRGLSNILNTTIWPENLMGIKFDEIASKLHNKNMTDFNLTKCLVRRHI